MVLVSQKLGRILAVLLFALSTTSNLQLITAQLTCPLHIQSKTISTLSVPMVEPDGSKDSDGDKLGTGSSANGMDLSGAGSTSGGDGNTIGGNEGNGGDGTNGNGTTNDGATSGNPTEGGATGDTGGGVNGGEGAGGGTGDTGNGTAGGGSTGNGMAGGGGTGAGTTNSPSATTVAPGIPGTPTTTSATFVGSIVTGTGNVVNGALNTARNTVHRNLQVVTTTTPDPVVGTVDLPTDVPVTTAPGIMTTSIPVPNVTGPSGSITAGSSDFNIDSSSVGETLTEDDAFVCDAEFYKQWETNGLKCGGQSIDVEAAVAASSCVIYSGKVGIISGSTCMSICSFPACNGETWEYGTMNGIASSVYQGVGIENFMTETMKDRLSARTSGASAFIEGVGINATMQCPYVSESSFTSCNCTLKASNSTKLTDDEQKLQKEIDITRGVIPNDDTTTVGSILAPTTQSIAGVTVFVSGLAAFAGGVSGAAAGATAGGATAASTTVAAVPGAHMGVLTIELCQFAVMINQLDLKGKSAALAMFGKNMAPSTFTFLPFGKLEDEDISLASPDDLASTNNRRRLDDLDSKKPSSGLAKYSRSIGIAEQNLFIVTIAGVFAVMGGLAFLFCFAYGVSGFFMDRKSFLDKFYDKLIGLELLVLILSQYTIGVTATYQIHYAMEQKVLLSDSNALAAIAALLFMGVGVLVYGWVVVRKHEDDIRDVGTATHVTKPVCNRFGPLYEEYKFPARFFFTAKMTLALATGITTGYVALLPKVQLSVIIVCHVLYFFLLEAQSPHHSKFVQTTTSFMAVMKITVLVLTFFLLNISTSNGLPADVQNGISLAIVGLNLFVLFLLMVRSAYTFYRKWQLQQDAKRNTEVITADAYFENGASHKQDQLNSNPVYEQNTRYEANDPLHTSSSNNQADQFRYEPQRYQQQNHGDRQYQQRYHNDRQSQQQFYGDRPSQNQRVGSYQNFNHQRNQSQGSLNQNQYQYGHQASRGSNYSQPNAGDVVEL